jgi:hypothetical protein
MGVEPLGRLDVPVTEAQLQFEVRGGGSPQQRRGRVPKMIGVSFFNRSASLTARMRASTRLKPSSATSRLRSNAAQRTAVDSTAGRKVRFR